MSLGPYRRVLARPSVRRILVLGTIARIPAFALGVTVTLHVVTTLERSYAAAGLVAAVATVTMAAVNPIRGRMLDRHGLRPVLLPCLLVSTLAWGTAPWVGYWPMLGLVVLGSVFVVPTFAIIRQTILAAVSDGDRRSAISLDSSALEISFMLAPAAAVWAATQWGTDWAFFGVQMLGVLAGVGIYVANPVLVEPHATAEEERSGHVRSRDWLTAPFLAVCLVAAVTTVLLSGSDLGIVAAMRELGQAAHIGIVLAVWGLGSLVGGFVYGTLAREVPARVLLLVLVLVTAPMALADNAWQLAGLAFVAGLLCAPTITATVDEATRAVPARVRGEATGWHGSALTVGGALGAPLAGIAIDTFGAGGAFVAVSLVGLLIVVTTSVLRGRAGTPSRPREAVTTR